MVPEPVPASVPMLTGAAKLPAASESCAVKVLPAGKVPVTVNETAAPAPTQKAGAASAAVVMVGATTALPKAITRFMSRPFTNSRPAASKCTPYTDRMELAVTPPLKEVAVVKPGWPSTTCAAAPLVVGTASKSSTRWLPNSPTATWPLAETATPTGVLNLAAEAPPPDTPNPVWPMTTSAAAPLVVGTVLNITTRLLFTSDISNWPPGAKVVYQE